MELLIKNVHVCDPQVGFDKVTDIEISGGVIKSIGRTDTEYERVIDGEGRLCVLPGLFDMHVHFRDPGLVYKEDIITGANAAKAGGFTGVAAAVSAAREGLKVLLIEKNSRKNILHILNLMVY